ncbi:MAG: aldo/keto reductase [Dehalococcoidia bacterium]|jgi:aryl-alcohol dehydrogenase-like predicted oxidoreductase|nr:aldo/keto reductase [Dehalococcoidia bacterium]
MRHRTIAGTDIQVSEVGFGVWTVTAGWWGEHSDEEAVTLLRQAFDRGVNFFDTADTYGNGRGETIMAEAFPGARRDEIVISTKFGYDWQSNIGGRREGHQEAPHSFEPQFLQDALDGSLHRLDTDRIDLWQLHNVRMEHLLLDDVWTFLDKARRDGKIRSVGVALGPAIGWLEEGLYSLTERDIEVVYMIYNALELDPGRELIAAAARSGRSLMARVPHSSGILEGGYDEHTTFPPNDHRNHRLRGWLLNGVKKIEQLSFLTEGGADGPGRTLGQAALRYILDQQEVVSALPNIYNLDQLDEFVGASDVADITPEEYRRVEQLFESNYGGLPPDAEVDGRKMIELVEATA